ncbi:MAG: class I SAM-dependent methyltransferase [Candidatus Omnitrophica bacterium]|nr:class I SAM-dependent methyltransferase [Candidatus Omnitrophota bacterium]
MKDLCEKAMAKGQRIDLSGCSYGETTGCCPFIERPTNYYYFLAGFVRILKLKNILEIGTHFGGAIMSMARAIPKRHISRSTLVTIDVTYKNEDGFKAYPYIKRIFGDSLSDKTVKESITSFTDPIDLLYIDSVHECGHTKKNIDIYAGALNPRYIILDDIRQCDSMQRLWSDLVEDFKNRAFDASDISIRKGAGFGVIEWRKI